MVLFVLSFDGYFIIAELLKIDSRIGEKIHFLWGQDTEFVHYASNYYWATQFHEHKALMKYADNHRSYNLFRIHLK